MAKNVIEFLSAELSLPTEKLEDHASLYHDLGVAGQDGWELLEAFGTTFGVDMNECDDSLYFGSEGANLPLMLWQFLTGTFVKESAERLEISHLKAVCERGRWFDP